MKTAFVTVRPEPRIRRDAICTGLSALGYAVRGGPPTTLDADTVLVCWNRYGDNHHHANRLEAAGGRVLVAENGYLGKGGSVPKFDLDGGFESGHYIALALKGHNGSGHWPSGDGGRFAALDAPLQPWRSAGDHILVCPNRSFGRPDLIMPSDWPQQVCKRLHSHTRRPIRLRSHPGTHAPARPIEADLSNCWAVVIWSSSAGLHALRHGVPVIRLAPAFVGAGADSTDLETIESPAMPERLPMFERMAWAQWTLAEIATGTPLKHLLGEQ